MGEYWLRGGVSRAVKEPPTNGEQESKTSLQHRSMPPSCSYCTNPGSKGHPEMCARPCLYFSSKGCTNGENCDFCHMYHPKRPHHLDKRGRELLATMSYEDCVQIILPILENKVQRMGIGGVATTLLNKLKVGALH